MKHAIKAPVLVLDEFALGGPGCLPVAMRRISMMELIKGEIAKGAKTISYRESSPILNELIKRKFADGPRVIFTRPWIRWTPLGLSDRLWFCY